jgi:hypothetical protein
MTFSRGGVVEGRERLLGTLPIRADPIVMDTFARLISRDGGVERPSNEAPAVAAA